MSAEAVQSQDAEPSMRGLVAAAKERKAIDLRVLHLGCVSDFTEYFVVCSGTSTRQVQAIADAVISYLKGEKQLPISREGYREGNWILLDFGSFVVHVFGEETRTYYGLERLWSDAPDVTGDFVS